MAYSYGLDYLCLTMKRLRYFASTSGIIRLYKKKLYFSSCKWSKNNNNNVCLINFLQTSKFFCPKQIKFKYRINWRVLT